MQGLCCNRRNVFATQSFSSRPTGNLYRRSVPYNSLIFRPKAQTQDCIDPIVQIFPGYGPFGIQIAYLRDVGDTNMCNERHSNPKDLHVKVRSADLNAPTLVDQMSTALLDHLIGCRTCSAIFVAQKHSLGEAGCVEGQRIVSESKIRWQERRANLALRHLTEQTLDDYLFDRLACDEREPVEHHLSCCPQCAKTIEERETLATWIKAAFYEREHGTNTSSNLTAVIQVQCSARGLSVCLKSKLGNNW
jgi:hypothetical protein